LVFTDDGGLAQIALSSGRPPAPFGSLVPHPDGPPGVPVSVDGPSGLPVSGVLTDPSTTTAPGSPMPAAPPTPGSGPPVWGVALPPVPLGNGINFQTPGNTQFTVYRVPAGLLITPSAASVNNPFGAAAFNLAPELERPAVIVQTPPSVSSAEVEAAVRMVLAGLDLPRMVGTRYRSVRLYIDDIAGATGARPFAERLLDAHDGIEIIQHTGSPSAAMLPPPAPAGLPSPAAPTAVWTSFVRPHVRFRHENGKVLHTLVVPGSHHSVRPGFVPSPVDRRMAVDDFVAYKNSGKLHPSTKYTDLLNNHDYYSTDGRTFVNRLGQPVNVAPHTLVRRTRADRSQLNKNTNPTRLYDVTTYRLAKRGETPLDAMEHDHIPAGESVMRRIELERNPASVLINDPSLNTPPPYGDLPAPRQPAQAYQRANAIEIRASNKATKLPKSLLLMGKHKQGNDHADFTPTFGSRQQVTDTVVTVGKSVPGQRPTIDAHLPEAAFQRDVQTMFDQSRGLPRNQVNLRGAPATYTSALTGPTDQLAQVGAYRYLYRKNVKDGVVRTNAGMWLPVTGDPLAGGKNGGLQYEQQATFGGYRTGLGSVGVVAGLWHDLGMPLPNGSSALSAAPGTDFFGSVAGGKPAMTPLATLLATPGLPWPSSQTRIPVADLTPAITSMIAAGGIFHADLARDSLLAGLLGEAQPLSAAQLRTLPGLVYQELRQDQRNAVAGLPALSLAQLGQQLGMAGVPFTPNQYTNLQQAAVRAGIPLNGGQDRLLAQLLAVPGSSVPPADLGLLVQLLALYTRPIPQTRGLDNLYSEELSHRGFAR
jgi:hypothetical protein